MSEDSRVVGGVKEEKKMLDSAQANSQVERYKKLEAADIKQQS